MGGMLELTTLQGDFSDRKFPLFDFDSFFNVYNESYAFFKDFLNHSLYNAPLHYRVINDIVRRNSQINGFSLVNRDKQKDNFLEERLKEDVKSEFTARLAAINIVSKSDVNPAHSDVEIASKLFSKGIIAHGILGNLYHSHMMDGVLADSGKRVVTTKFRNPVFPEDKLDYKLSETTKNEDNPSKRGFETSISSQKYVNPDKNPNGLVTRIESVVQPYFELPVYQRVLMPFSKLSKDYHNLPTFNEYDGGEAFYRFEVTPAFLHDMNVLVHILTHKIEPKESHYKERRDDKDVSGLTIPVVESLGLGNFEPGAGTIYRNSKTTHNWPVFEGDTIYAHLTTTKTDVSKRVFGYKINIFNQLFMGVAESSGEVMLDPARDTYFK